MDDALSEARAELMELERCSPLAAGPPGGLRAPADAGLVLLILRTPRAAGGAMLTGFVVVVVGVEVVAAAEEVVVLLEATTLFTFICIR
jgi:hypothetical protein